MFAVGNRIKLRPYMGGDNLTEGKVYEVINTIISLNKVTITNDLAIKEMVPAWLFELVLTPQFKVGDVVVCNTDINPSSFTQGNSYTIIESREGSVPGYIHMIDDEGEYNGWKTVFFDLVPIENITTVDTKTGEVMEFRQVAERHNDGKADLTLLPKIACEQEALVWEFGAKKYTRDNWKKLWGDKTYEVANASLMRHAFAIASGELIDKETGLPHAAHIRCNAAMILEYQMKKEKK